MTEESKGFVGDMAEAVGAIKPAGEVQVEPCTGPLETILKERAVLVTAMEAKEEELKKLGSELAAVDDAVCARFESEGMTSAKIAGLGSFIMQRRTFASILPEKKVEAIDLFEKEFPDIVQKTINGQTLSAFWREAKKTGAPIPESIRACIKESETKFIQWRR